MNNIRKILLVIIIAIITIAQLAIANTIEWDNKQAYYPKEKRGRFSFSALFQPCFKDLIDKTP